MQGQFSIEGKHQLNSFLFFFPLKRDEFFSFSLSLCPPNFNKNFEALHEIDRHFILERLLHETNEAYRVDSKNLSGQRSSEDAKFGCDSPIELDNISISF